MSTAAMVRSRSGSERSTRSSARIRSVVSNAVAIAVSIERVLAAEGPEDRALGDPGRLGDLLGADVRTELLEQRQRGLDDGGAPFLGW